MHENGGLTRRRSWHGPASARRPSRLVRGKTARRHAARIRAPQVRRAACRTGFGTWALAVQLSV